MSLTPQHRALIAQHGDSVADVRGRWSVDFDEHGIAAFIVAVERAARADERQRMIAGGWRQCAVGQRTTQFCGMAEQARADEREACARLCDGIAAGAKQMDGLDGDYESGVEAGAEQCASALRARDAGDGEGGR